MSAMDSSILSRKTTSLGPRNYVIRPLDEQAQILRNTFVNLRDAHLPSITLASPAIPRVGGQGIDGWFVIPNPLAIAKTYGEAVVSVLAALSVQRSMRVWPTLDSSDSWKVAATTDSALNQLTEKQRSNLIVVPLQSGYRYRFYPASEIDDERMDNEFGLGAFAVGCLLLTHPARLQSSKDLWIDCPGDEFKSHPSAQPEVPFFSFASSRLNFCVSAHDECGHRSGLATGFVP